MWSRGALPLSQALDIAKAAEGDGPEAPAEREPRLLERLRQALPSRHYSPRTEPTYCDWVKRFIFCHHVRRPNGAGIAPAQGRREGP
jgi:hypothetical protein